MQALHALNDGRYYFSICALMACIPGHCLCFGEICPRNKSPGRNARAASKTQFQSCIYVTSDAISIEANLLMWLNTFECAYAWGFSLLLNVTVLQSDAQSSLTIRLCNTAPLLSTLHYGDVMSLGGKHFAPSLTEDDRVVSQYKN